MLLLLVVVRLNSLLLVDQVIMATATPVDTPVESSVVVDSKQTYCFSDLVSLSASVPFRVRFITSDAQVSAQLSHNTIMDVYAIQRSNAAVLCRHCDQQQIKYIMPFESSFKCSPIYNPNNNIKEAMRGYKYNSINELQQANPQPLAVNVTIGYLDTDDTSASMETGDTYVIKNGMKPSTGSGELAVDEDVLVCEDAVTHQYKHLHYTSTCFLNTTPSNLLLKPSDFFLSLSPPADILIHNLPSSIIPAATSGASSSAVFTVTKILPLLTISTHILSKTVILDIYGHEELPAEVELVQDVPPLEYQQMKLRAELESMTSTNETREDCISVVFMTDDNDCTTSKALSFTDGLQKLFLCSKQFNDRDDYLLKLHSATIVKSE